MTTTIENALAAIEELNTLTARLPGVLDEAIQEATAQVLSLRTDIEHQRVARAEAKAELQKAKSAGAPAQVLGPLKRAIEAAKAEEERLTNEKRQLAERKRRLTRRKKWENDVRIALEKAGLITKSNKRKNKKIRMVTHPFFAKADAASRRAC